MWVVSLLGAGGAMKSSVECGIPVGGCFVSPWLKINRAALGLTDPGRSADYDDNEYVAISQLCLLLHQCSGTI